MATAKKEKEKREEEDGDDDDAECRKLQIVVKISVNFWQCFSLADVVVTFATL